MKVKRIIEIEESDFEIIKGLDKTTCSSVVDSAYEAIRQSAPYNPSDDAISRSSIKNTVVDLAFNPNDMGDEQVCAFNGALQMVCDAIDSAPAINLEKHSFIEGYKEGCGEGKRCYERPKGKWIEVKDKFAYATYYHWDCSLCGTKYGKTYNFCPNCGADMRETDPVISAIQENNAKYNERPNIDFDGMSYELGGDKE